MLSLTQWPATGLQGLCWPFIRGIANHPDATPRLMLTAHRNPVLGRGPDEAGDEDRVKGCQVLHEIFKPIISVNHLWAFSTGASTHIFFNDGPTLIHGEMCKCLVFHSFMMRLM